MRFLIIVSDFPKVTETFVISNALHFLAQGHELSIFHLKPFRKNELTHPHAEPAIRRGKDIGWLGTQSRVGILWALRKPLRLGAIIGRLVWAFRSEPSRLFASLAIVPKSLAMAREAKSDGVNHIHAEFAGYPATSAWIIAQMTGIRFSFSAHAHDIFLTQSLLPTKINAADFVRAISVFNQNFLNELPGVPPNRVELLRCGVSLCEPPLAPADPGGENPLRLLFVGALLPRKGVQHLLGALDMLPADLNWHLTVIGAGSQDQVLRDVAGGLPKGRVSFLGAQTSEVVKAEMAKANVVVVPSVEGEGGRSEGIPVVIMEALSLKRPVIASRLSGIPELVEDGVTGYLTEPGAEAEIANQILAISQDFTEAKKRGVAGRKRIEEMFDIEKTAQQLLDRMIEMSD